jgi:hypothetical protein
MFCLCRLERIADENRSWPDSFSFAGSVSRVGKKNQTKRRRYADGSEVIGASNWETRYSLSMRPAMCEVEEVDKRRAR